MPPENFENNLPLIFEGNNEESSESSSDSESDYQLGINSRAPLFNNSIFVVSYIDGLWAPDIYKYYILIGYFIQLMPEPIISGVDPHIWWRLAWLIWEASQGSFISNFEGLGRNQVYFEVLELIIDSLRDLESEPNQTEYSKLKIRELHEFVYDLLQ